jgi:hypothetical protein
MATQCLSFNSTCSTLAYGCYLYTDDKKTIPVSTGWISDGTNVYSINSSGMITAVIACTSCQPSGTYITYYCSGYDLYYTYADGNCGTYDTLIEYNSATCGYMDYTCDCGYGCALYANPCYYYGCYNC